ncbi:MAG TPA: YetF domain-containing protein [Burkholderiaceae bacterium]
MLRAVAIYVFLLILFRVMGKRALSEMSTFDFILLLILSEATSNALVDDDKSVVTAFTVIVTFLLADLGLSLLKRQFKTVAKVAEGLPVLLVQHGKPIELHLQKNDVSVDEVLQMARHQMGLERIDQIKYAVLETSGGISIVPVDEPATANLDTRIENAVARALARRDAQT